VFFSSFFHMGKGEDPMESGRGSSLHKTMEEVVSIISILAYYHIFPWKKVGYFPWTSGYFPRTSGYFPRTSVGENHIMLHKSCHMTTRDFT